MHGGWIWIARVCYVAWLKNLSRNPVALREDTSEKELAQSVLNELCEHAEYMDFSKNSKEYWIYHTICRDLLLLNT